VADPALGLRELHRLIGAQAVDLTPIDPLLLDPGVDRCFAHPERDGQPLDTRLGTSKFADLAAGLWRVPLGHPRPLCAEATLLENARARYRPLLLEI
jgi:hypothetical protein